jgi:hypothetical protein
MLVRFVFGHRVVHVASTPGMATQYSLYRQVRAFKNAPFLNGLYGVM